MKIKNQRLYLFVAGCGIIGMLVMVPSYLFLQNRKTKNELEALRNHIEALLQRDTSTFSKPLKDSLSQDKNEWLLYSETFR